MAHAARALRMGVMLGCMLESGLGIAAGCCAAPLCDHIDLDGNLLLREDPWPGVDCVDGVQTLPLAPGLGVAACATRSSAGSSEDQEVNAYSSGRAPSAPDLARRPRGRAKGIRGADSSRSVLGDGTWRVEGKWWKRPGSKGSNVEAVAEWGELANEVLTDQARGVLAAASRS